MSETNSQSNKKFVVFAICFAVFLVVAYVIFRSNTKLNGVTTHSQTALDETNASQVMVVVYTEKSNETLKTKLRVETPHGFAYTPSKLTVLGANNTEVGRAIPVKTTSSPYICMSMEDGEHPMMGYETDLFVPDNNTMVSYENTIKVEFTDESGNGYVSVFPIEHTCMQDMDLKTDLNPSQVDLPSE